MPTPMPIESVGDYRWGLSGLLSPGKEKKGKENETNGKAHPVKATHFDYITKPSSSNGRSSPERPRAPKHHQSQGQGYSRSRHERPPREDRRYRHSTGDYRNGSSSMHHHNRSGTERRYSREDDEELMHINSQRQRYEDRGEKRSGSLPSHYSQDSRGKNRRGSLPGQYGQGSPTSPRGPPKPPRRQESLNRVHIPERPDTEFTTSTSEYEICSPSSGSSSPKNWKVSPLIGHTSSGSKQRERSWSPSKEYSRSPPRRQRSPERKQKYDTRQYAPDDRSCKRDASHERKQRHDNQLYDQSSHYGKRDRSLDRNQKHYDNRTHETNGDYYGQQDGSHNRRQNQYSTRDNGYSDHYGKQDFSPERQNGRYSRSHQPSANGYQADKNSAWLPSDPYSPDPTPFVHSSSPYNPFSFENPPTSYGEDYQQKPPNQQQKQKLNSDPYGNSWIKEKNIVPSRPTSNARPLVLPPNDKVPEGPRPVYRSDGEIDLREPTYKKSREPDMFAINQAPPSNSYPSSPTSKPSKANFNYYPEFQAESEPRDMQWEEPSQQVSQMQPKQTNSLRTVREVKAYDQHMKKFKRPTSLGGVPRQPQNTFSQGRPRSAIEQPASDDGLYPSLERSKNSAFGVAAASPKNPSNNSTYKNQYGISPKSSQQYSEPIEKSYSNGEYGINNHKHNQQEIYNENYAANKGSSLLPKDWPEDYPAQMTIRSPVPSDPENSVNSVKQVDSGKQTIFCLVSQVVPTSPSPELSPEPMQREFVEIENGKVSPVMKQPVNVPKLSPNQYSQKSPVQNGYSQRGSYSPVRSQMEYQTNQGDLAWRRQLEEYERRQSVQSTVSQDSSMGNESVLYRQRQSAGYTQQALHQAQKKIASSQIEPKKAQVNYSNPKDHNRGASLSSGYHSSPEFEREQNQQTHQPRNLLLDRERFSDTEYRFGGTGKENEVDNVPIVPVKDLIKKINRDVETNGGLDEVVPPRRASADLKSILVRDAQQSNQAIKDDTCYGKRAVRRDSKDTQTQTYEISGKVHSHPSAYYNEQYITATAVPCEVVDTTERKSQTYARPLSNELRATDKSYRDESRPDVKQESPDESEEDTKPINAKDRRAFYESLKPLSKEEEILSVVSHKNRDEATPSNTHKKVDSQPKAVYGSIKWPKDHSAREPEIKKQTVKQSFAEPPKVKKAQKSPSPVNRSEMYSDDDQSKPDERHAYYDRLRQRGQGTGPGLKGRRSQSLPRLNSRTREGKSESSKVSSTSVELAEGDSSAKRLSMGAQLFQQRKLEMERLNKKQEILEKVKNQLKMHRAGSEPNLAPKDEENDAISSLEQNGHLLATHVAGKRIRGRDSADFEYALNQLQTIHTEADQDADEILHPQYYRPFDHRAAEIPLLAQKVAELQELIGVHATPGSGKHRKKGKRATSDVSEMRPTLHRLDGGELQEKPGKAKKGQEFFPYRQATHPKKMVKKDEYNPACDHESTSDEDKTPRPVPPGTNTKLYRHPKSSDNLGFSSDSSPERPVKVKVKLVAPEYVRVPSPDLRASRQQRKTTREVFFSGEDNSRGPSPIPTKVNTNKKMNSHHHPANLPPPVMQSVKFVESPKVKRAVLTKPPPAPAVTKFKETQAHLQLPGCRDSVSTVDSAALAQPFDDMVDEYQDIMMDHQAVEMSLPDPERTSSVESLMHMVSGSHRQNNTTPETKPNQSFSPGGYIPLADEEDYESSGGDEADLEGKNCPLAEVEDV
ncbi:uncharacterized protein LOC121421982 [Lytechinus variegatus]|uniref:uncharacterized protein LOC121421982 n=1 Tax=Lytechinus variegatus TaxID=7654 RepID=UPI001BB15F40|nr:uncharacterized protein LOC121421982 [Lytechinus variegatus]